MTADEFETYYVIAHIACGVGAITLTFKSKNNEGCVWLLACLVFGPLALFVAWISREKADTADMN